jgi:hypothetical protein
MFLYVVSALSAGKANKNKLFLTRRHEGEWIVMEKPLCPFSLCVRLNWVAGAAACVGGKSKDDIL